MMIDDNEWAEVRRLFNSAVPSSFHCSVSSIGPEGEPWVTPIGSILLHETGRASYFELFARGLGQRLSIDPRVSLLAVDSGKWLWLDALARGRFSRPPAMRLRGIAQPTRAATPKERARFGRRVRGVRRLRGGKLLWSRLDVAVRDIEVEHVERIRLGPMAVR